MSKSKICQNLPSPKSPAVLIVLRFSCSPGRGLHEGYKGRLLEFERFELKFKECLSNSAIKTKFEQHHSRGLEIVLELEELINFESQQATQKK